jgi:hypothetical protein
MKTKKILFILIINIFISILLCSLILADVSIEVQKKNPDGSPVLINDLSSQTKANINSIIDYAKTSYSQGRIIVDENEVTTLSNNGKIVLSIPKGIKLENKNSVLTVTGKIVPIINYPERPDIKTIPKLSIGELELNSEKEISLNFKENIESGIQTISFNGDKINLQDSAVIKSNTFEFGLGGFGVNGDVKEGTIVIDSKNKKINSIDVKFKEGTDGTIRVAKERSGNLNTKNNINEVFSKFNEYNNLKEASFKLNKGETDYASLTSSKGGSYSFNYKGKSFIFKAEKNGHIVFNPLEGKISGENSELAFEGGKNINSFKGFSGVIDENGNIKNIDLKEGGWYSDSTNRKYSSTKGDLKLFFNGEAIKGIEGNVVSFDKDEKVYLKGFVKTTGYPEYEGKSDNAYTEFNPKFKKEDGTIPFFDVKEGNADLNNGKHKIIIENGKAKLELNKGLFNVYDQNPISYGFAIYNNGEKIEGYLDEGKKEYNLIVYNKNGEKTIRSMESSKWSNELGTKKLNSQKEKETISTIGAIDKRVIELKNELNGKTSKELDSLELYKIYLEKQLRDIYGEPRDEVVVELKKYLENERNLESKANAQLMLGEMLNQKIIASTPPKEIAYLFPEVFSSGPVASVSYKEGLYFRTDRNGNIIGYSPDGTNYVGTDYDPANFPSGKISYDSISVINELKQKGWTVDSLLQDRIVDKGLAKDSYEYKQIETSAKETRDLLSAAKEYFQKNSDSKSAGMADIYIAQSYQSTDSSSTLNEFERIIRENTDSSIKSEATRLMALSNFEVSPSNNAGLVMQQLRQAILLDPNNKQALYDLDKISSSFLDSRIKAGYAEPEKIISDVFAKIGEGSTNPYAEKLKDGVFHPVRAIYSQATGTEELVSTVKSRLDENDRTLLGAQGIRVLTKNSYDVSNYLTSSEENKFETISRLNGLDSVISTDKIKDYMTRSGFDFNAEDINSQSKKLFDLIAKEEGDSKANLYFNNFNRATTIMGAIRESVQKDPALYLIATNGEEIKGITYTGEEKDFDSAFTRDRVGKSIDRTWGDTAISIGDFGVSSIALTGAGGYIGRGIGAAAEFIPGLSKVVEGANVIINPGQLIAAKTLSQEAGFISRITVSAPFDIISQTGIITTSNIALGPLGGTVSEILTFMNPAAGLERKIGKEIGILRAGTEEIIESRVSKEALKNAEKIGFTKVSESVYAGVDSSGRNFVVYAGENIPRELKEIGFSRITSQEAEERIGQIIEENSRRNIETVSEQALDTQSELAIRNIGRGSLGESEIIKNFGEINPKYYFDLGEKSKDLVPGISQSGMRETINVDGIPNGLKQTINDKFDSTIGSLGPDASYNDYLKQAVLFSKEMKESLPFLGYENIYEARAEIADQRTLFYEYLKKLENGDVKLSGLIKTNDLDCNGQALTMYLALGGEKSGFNLYGGISSTGEDRVHSFLAKQIEINGEKNMLIIDPTELDLYVNAVGINPGYLRSHSLVVAEEEFKRIGYNMHDLSTGVGSIDVIAENNLKERTIGIENGAKTVSEFTQGDLMVYPPTCFVAGTMILMFDGSSKPIEKIKIGDFVKSYNYDFNEINSKVLELESPIRDGYYNINFDDGSNLSITDEHPIYIIKNNYSGWASINPKKTQKYYYSFFGLEKIEIGDYALQIKNKTIKINGINFINQTIKTYNLKHINSSHTFFANSFLVHNKALSATQEKILSTQPIDTVNTIVNPGVMYSDEMVSVQRDFTKLTPEAKVELMDRIGFIDNEEYLDLLSELLHPNSDTYLKVRKFEDQLFASKTIWNDPAYRIGVSEEIFRYVQNPNNMEMLVTPMTNKNFNNFIKTANIEPQLATPESITKQVDTVLRSDMKTEFNVNYYVSSPEEAEKVGRELLNKYIVEPYGSNSLDMAASHYSLELKNPDLPNSYVGRIRRDVQGDYQQFTLKDGTTRQMQLPPHINVEIPRARVIKGDGTFTEADITIHVFYKPI